VCHDAGMDLLLRPALGADADRVAEILLASRAAHLPYLPQVHPPEDVRQWVATTLVASGGVIVAEQDGLVNAFVAALPDDADEALGWIAQLYAAPGHTGRGLGTRLLHAGLARLALAGARRVRLYTFQANTAARRFYERHGFVVVAMGDGHDNEERCPDVLYEWPLDRA
jgi:RimJ/RimL family protein N-acetyltransferase